MQSLITIFREVRDPRDFNARHGLSAILFIALAATLCGAKSCVDIADFAAANEADLAEIVDLPHGAPSHDSFSRLFRVLDPNELATVFTRFAKLLRPTRVLLASVMPQEKCLSKTYSRTRRDRSQQQ